MTATAAAPRPHAGRRVLDALNGRWHAPALQVFAVVVVVHWVEHLAQAAQIWVLGMPRPQARGLVGEALPWLVTHEWLHYGFAIGMLGAFAVLLPGFTGASRWWWALALALQCWHHLEHLLLLGQALSGTAWFGRSAPTSIAQLVLPRVELHLLYNGIVTVPMLAAMYRHRQPPPSEPAPACSCARPHRLAVQGA